MNSIQKNAPSTLELERINWIEFREWVPAKINTVLLTLGTLEPHGVAPNGADILAPVAIAREIAPRINAASQSKFTSGSVLTRVGSPFISRLLKYSPRKPAAAPFTFSVNTDAGTGTADTPILYAPGE